MMKQADVKIGKTYKAKVSDKLTEVRIDAASSAGGWDATNLATGKKVRIKSARRLREPAMTGAMARAISAADQQDAELRDEIAAAGGEPLVLPDEAAPRRAKKAQVATRAPRTASGARGPSKRRDGRSTTKDATRAKSDKTGPGGKRTGVLDAAVEILGRSKEPMSCKAIVEQAIERKLWTTTGKTPAATLYSAILREIAKKGDDARFVNVDRGRFSLRR